MEWTLIDIIFICAGVGLGAFVKGAIGFGLPMIATPLMLFAMPLPEVVAVMLAPVLLTNIQQCWLNRQHWRSLAAYWPMMVASVAVLLPGSRLLVMFDAAMLAAIVGGMIFVLVVVDSLPRGLWVMRQLAKIDGRKLLVPAGLLSGISGSFTSIYSFPILQLMVSLRLPKDEFVFVIGVFLLCGYTSVWSGLAMTGFPTPAIAIDTVWALVPGAIGLIAGNSIRNRLSADAFRKLVNIALAIAGISLIVKFFLV